jgi:hypothetical protein
MAPQTEIERYFYCRIAVIEMGPGESKEDAWSLHVLEHPEDAYADIKVFNRPSLPADKRWLDAIPRRYKSP